MKKYIVGIISLLLVVAILIIYFIVTKKTEYTPMVEYEDNINWEDIERTDIIFNGSTVSSEGNGYLVNDNTVTIKAGGSYYLSGEYTGNIIVDSESTVYLVFNNLTIKSLENSPIYVKNATKVVINVLEGTTNTLIDTSNYNETTEGIDATIYSKDDLVIMGSGELYIEANYQHGINCKDTLQIMDVVLNIKAVNDGIRGKDYLAIKSGDFTIETESDGLKATNEIDSTLGYIIIDGGTFNINVKGDAIQAITILTINNGTFTITTNNTNYEVSAKGLKSSKDIIINNGTFILNTFDDAIHSNDSITIYNGIFTINSEDDGIHADNCLKIEDGNIEIMKSYEGIEALEITINGGDITTYSDDDGINIAGGKDLSSFNGPRENNFASSTGNLYIQGGTIYIDASGDGIDINGGGTMTDGTVIISGPTDNGNGALDYDGTFEINGGMLLAAGYSSMMQTPSNTSKQYSLSITFSTTILANQIVSIQNDDNEEIISFSLSKNCQNIIFSSSKLKKGTNYSIYTGGNHSGTYEKGLYSNGSYTNGTLYQSVLLSNIVTSVGTQGHGMNGGNFPRR